MRHQSLATVEGITPHGQGEDIRLQEPSERWSHGRELPDGTWKDPATSRNVAQSWEGLRKTHPILSLSLSMFTDLLLVSL